MKCRGHAESREALVKTWESDFAALRAAAKFSNYAPLDCKIKPFFSTLYNILASLFSDLTNPPVQCSINVENSRRSARLAFVACSSLFEKSALASCRANSLLHINIILNYGLKSVAAKAATAATVPTPLYKLSKPFSPDSEPS